MITITENNVLISANYNYKLLLPQHYYCMCCLPVTRSREEGNGGWGDMYILDYYIY